MPPPSAPNSAPASGAARARAFPWWVRGPAIALASVVLFFSLSEFALATFDLIPKRANPIVIWNPEWDADIRNPRGQFRFNADWLWEPRPGATIHGSTINDAGYRGPEYPVARTGRFRVATMGDSSTFGFNLREEESWSRRLERQLRESGIDSEVLNFGVVGFTAIQGLELYKGRVRKYRPDVVVTAFGCCNDQFPRESGLDDVAKIAVTRPLHFRLRMFLDRYTTFRVLDRAVERIAGGAANPRPAPPPSNGAGPDCEDVRVPLREFERAIAEIQRMQREDGHSLALVCPPRMISVEEDWPCTKGYTKLVHEIAPKLGVPLAEVYDPFRQSELEDRRLLFEQLKARAAERGETPPRDPASVPLKRGRYFLDPFHPNPDGHEVYATIVHRALRTGGFLGGARLASEPAR